MGTGKFMFYACGYRVGEVTKATVEVSIIGRQHFLCCAIAFRG